MLVPGELDFGRRGWNKEYWVESWFKKWSKRLILTSTPHSTQQAGLPTSAQGTAAGGDIPERNDTEGSSTKGRRHTAQKGIPRHELC